MKTQEHKLIVFMLAQQFQRLMALVKALESKGLLEPDDIIAYEHLVMAQEDMFPRFFVETAKQYEEYAEGLGLQVKIGDSDTGQDR